MSETETRPYIGGQAVIEGVMMRSPRSFSIVVRRRSGALVVRERAALDARKGIWAWPFVRGVATLVEAVKLGSEALRFSSELYEQDLEEAESGTTPPKPGLLSVLSLPFALFATQDLQKEPGPRMASEASSGRRAMSFITILFALGLFVALPQAAAAGASRFAHLDLDVRSPLFQALTGAFKLTIVVGYLLLIRRVPEIRRVFQYHGAEHKTISTYEAGEALAVVNARSKSTLHPRCGTTFLVMVALVSILVFTAIGPLLPRFHVGGLLDNVFFFLLKLPFLPLIAAVTFEIQRIFARYCTTGPLRLVLWPGFLVQKITTIEPDDDQLEVALASLQATLWRESAAREAASERDGIAHPSAQAVHLPIGARDQTFVDFAAILADPGYRKLA
jgi:uncharacterized protein YqhQ